MFKWVMGLCIRHTTTLKPAIKHFRCPLQLSFTKLRWYSYLIYPTNT
jgi:hypothetical protein